MKWPGSLSASRCPPSMLPRGNMGLPNSCMVFKWHNTGSPIAAVAEEKFGSSKVHCSNVPAGTSWSCARPPAANTSSATVPTKTPMSRFMFVLQVVVFGQLRSTAARDSRVHRQHAPKLPTGHTEAHPQLFDPTRSLRKSRWESGIFFDGAEKEICWRQFQYFR